MTRPSPLLTVGLDDTLWRIRSDVLPGVEVGAFAAHVPPPLTWSHEVAEIPVGHPRFAELPTIAHSPAWLEGREAEVGRPRLSGRTLVL